MAATLEDIRSWLARGREMGATHVIVKCDSFGNDAECCRPLYVLPGEDPRKKADEFGMRTMEAYSLRLDEKQQLSERRAFHWD